MSEEIVKFINILLIAALLIIGGQSCNSEKSGKEKQAQAAEKMMSDINKLYSGKDYNNALVMIDSLMKTYPGVIDTQRKALHVRTLIMERCTINDSIDNENVLTENIILADSLAKRLTYVKNEDMVEGYYVSTLIPYSGVMSATGITARVSDNGELSLVSTLSGHRISHSSIRAITDTLSATTSVIPTGNSRNYYFSQSGVEAVTYLQTECDSICHFIQLHTKDHIGIVFIGKRNYKMTLSQKEKQAISEVYAYYQATHAVEKAQIERVKFARKLQLTRKQIKQTAVNLKGN